MSLRGFSVTRALFQAGLPATVNTCPGPAVIVLVG
jgi:hypothetical protein